MVAHQGYAYKVRANILPLIKYNFMPRRKS
jgi:hypothetical protein